MDWAGNIFICLGIWYIGEKRRFAFLFSIVGEAFWLVYSLQHQLYSLAFIVAVFGVLAFRNWILWGRQA